MSKKLPLIFLFFICFVKLQAQIKLGAEIGFHSASVIEHNQVPGWDTAQKSLYSSKSGIHIGIITEMQLGHSQLYFQPGLNYSSKGRQYNKYFDTVSSGSGIDTIYSKTKLQLGYIEIPFYFTYKIPLSSNHRTNFFIGAGPYIAFILNSKMNIQSLTILNDTTPKYSNETDDLLEGNAVNKYKTFDYGINGKAGFEFGNVMLSGYFSRGLSNFYTASYQGNFHHQLFGATLGVWLGRSSSSPSVVMTARDTDKDGIPDDQDMCPLKPGFAKYNGCPVPDTDHDGIDDDHDSCKTVAGSAKYHGCPVPDRDHDGIADEIDKCPDTPGTAENNGCPEIKNEMKDRINFVARNIQFATKSNELSATSYYSLNELSQILANHTELHLTIEGHTDNVGTPEHNQVLSQQRAEAVKSYLVSHGVPENRITATGMGMYHPKTGNQDAEGKAINRRVELKLTTQ